MVARAPTITSMRAVGTEKVFKALQLDEPDKQMVLLEKRSPKTELQGSHNRRREGTSNSS